MKDIPVIFSGPMVRALLEGRKTMTRRIIKLPAKGEYVRPDMGGWAPTTIGGGKSFTVTRDGTRVPCPETVAIWNQTTGTCIAAKYQPSDRLWVRENHRLTDCECTEACRGAGHVWYDADESGHRNVSNRKLRPSIHMPRWASRLTLIVTRVKIERLQEISETEAIAEGIDRPFSQEECRSVAGLEGSNPEDHGWVNYLWHGRIGHGISGAQLDAWHHQYSTYKHPRGSFSSLWALINGPENWNANPFVSAVTFRVLKANVDSQEAKIAA